VTRKKDQHPGEGTLLVRSSCVLIDLDGESDSPSQFNRLLKQRNMTHVVKP